MIKYYMVITMSKYFDKLMNFKDKTGAIFTVYGYDDVKKIPMLCPCEIENMTCNIDNIPPMFNFTICMRCIAKYWKTKICDLFE